MAEVEADHVFVYGKLRPDAPENTEPLSNSSGAKKAWLMGSRLYCFDKGGQNSAAVRLEEAGHAVKGYVVQGGEHGGAAAESEAKEYSPQLYERDVVEVITEKEREFLRMFTTDLTSMFPILSPKEIGWSGAIDDDDDAKVMLETICGLERFLSHIESILTCCAVAIYSRMVQRIVQISIFGLI